ncbi:hypothetical protein ACU686_27320 [Yinghuangia aomiensis]
MERGADRVHGAAAAGERAALALVALLTVFVVVAQADQRRRPAADPRAARGGGVGVVGVRPHAAAVGAAAGADRGLDRHIAEGLAASERRAGRWKSGSCCRWKSTTRRRRVRRLPADAAAGGGAGYGDVDPGAARGHVATASGIAERNPAEARRFVHDLAPARPRRRGSLEQALRLVAERTTEQGVVTRFRTDGARMMLRARAPRRCWRVAQGAVANVLEHAGLRGDGDADVPGDDVALDIADNGRGFDLKRRGDPGGSGQRGPRASGDGRRGCGS